MRGDDSTRAGFISWRRGVTAIAPSAARPLVASRSPGLQKFLVSSSATRKMGFPPLEIDMACATAFWAEGDAAAA